VLNVQALMHIWPMGNELPQPPILLGSRGALHQRSRTRRKLGASASRLMLEDRLRCALRPPVARHFKEEALEMLLLPYCCQALDVYVGDSSIS
jgi:hypothetical protein